VRRKLKSAELTVGSAEVMRWVWLSRFVKDFVDGPHWNRMSYLPPVPFGFESVFACRSACGLTEARISHRKRELTTGHCENVAGVGRGPVEVCKTLSA
jgi:hypothetical protein